MAFLPSTPQDLIDRYDVFLLDAYGVLVNQGGALPGAAAFIDAIDRAGKTYLLLSNDASRSLDTTFARYTRFGLPVRRDRILTSGMLLVDHFAARGFVGARCQVLGSRDSEAYVADAGGVVCPPGDDSASVCVAADDDGFPFLETVGAVVTALLRRLDRGEPVHLVLPNPDLVFPRADGSVGVTAGALAAMIEAILRLRDPEGRLRFEPLGKPHRPIYEAAMRRLGHPDPARIVMVGDQPLTDIDGASRFGLASALVLTGIGKVEDARRAGITPTYVVNALAEIVR